MTDLEVYRQESSAFIAPVARKQDALLEFALGLGGEAGECQEVVKKALFQGHTLDEDALAEELGDVLWYLDKLAAVIGRSLVQIADGNLRKLRNRYPNGFEVEKSVNRNAIAKGVREK